MLINLLLHSMKKKSKIVLASFILYLGVLVSALYLTFKNVKNTIADIAVAILLFFPMIFFISFFLSGLKCCNQRVSSNDEVNDTELTMDSISPPPVYDSLDKIEKRIETPPPPYSSNACTEEENSQQHYRDDDSVMLNLTYGTVLYRREI